MRDLQDEFPLTGIRVPWRPGFWRVVARTLLALLLIAAVALTLLSNPHLLDHPIAFFDGPPGSVTYVDPRNGWTLQFPKGWHAQAFSELHHGVYTAGKHGVLVSNVNRRFVTARAPGIIWTSDFDMRNLPVDIALVAVGQSYGGGPGRTCLYDTPLPLSLEDAAQRDAGRFDDPRTGFKKVALGFTVGGSPTYFAAAWVGPKATSSDLAVLDGIVRSIWYEETGDPEYGEEDCHKPL